MSSNLHTPCIIFHFQFFFIPSFFAKIPFSLNDTQNVNRNMYIYSYIPPTFSVSICRFPPSLFSSAKQRHAIRCTRDCKNKSYCPITTGQSRRRVTLASAGLRATPDPANPAAAPSPWERVFPPRNGCNFRNDRTFY